MIFIRIKCDQLGRGLLFFDWTIIFWIISKCFTPRCQSASSMGIVMMKYNFGLNLSTSLTPRIGINWMCFRETGMFVIGKMSANLSKNLPEKKRKFASYIFLKIDLQTCILSNRTNSTFDQNIHLAV